MKAHFVLAAALLIMGCRTKTTDEDVPTPPPDRPPEPPARSCKDILFDLEQTVVSEASDCDTNEDCGCFDQEYDEGKCGVVTRKDTIRKIEKFAAEARAADCELPRPCPDFECKPHCRPRPGFTGYCTTLTRCVELSEEFDEVLSGASRKCKTDEDCGIYRAGVGMNCGGVTDIETVRKLADIADEFFKIECQYTVNCAPRAAFHAECRSSTCIEVSDAP